MASELASCVFTAKPLIKIYALVLGLNQIAITGFYFKRMDTNLTCVYVCVCVCLFGEQPKLVSQPIKLGERIQFQANYFCNSLQPSRFLFSNVQF